MSEWFNYVATLKILVFGLLMGGALPGLFALATRVNAAGIGLTGSAGPAVAARRRPVLIAVSWALVALVVVVVAVAVLFIARDFIAHHTGWYILGAEAT